MEDLSYVGQRLPKTDAYDKVTGRAVYMNDLTRPGMLHGKIKYSEHAHARILNIDTSAAKKLPGVKAVFDGVRRAGDQDRISKGQPAPQEGQGAPVSGRGGGRVAATDPEVAAEAIDLIKVEYEPLPGVFDPLEALKPEAPLIHETDARGKPAESNVLKLPWKLVCGDVEEGRSLSKYMVREQLYDHLGSIIAAWAFPGALPSSGWTTT